jgi:hypothetical protein
MNKNLLARCRNFLVLQTMNGTQTSHSWENSKGLGIKNDKTTTERLLWGRDAIEMGE